MHTHESPSYPDGAGRGRSRKIPIDHVDQEHAARAERLEDPLRHGQILVFFEVAEGGVPTEHSVEHLFEGHLTHVALQKVDLLAALLGHVCGQRELIQRQIIANDAVATARELDRMVSGTTTEIEHHATGSDAERFLDERHLTTNVFVRDARACAHEVFVEQIFPPRRARLRTLSGLGRGQVWRRRRVPRWSGRRGRRGRRGR